jgi:hypothetical protein
LRPSYCTPVHPHSLEFGFGSSSLPRDSLLKVRSVNPSAFCVVAVLYTTPSLPLRITTKGFIMYFAVTFVASLLVSTSALVTPHAGDSIYRRHQHASLARRAAAPDPAGQPLEASAAIPKRQLRKRCKPRKTSSALSATSAATSAASAPSNDPANVAPLPSSKHTTSHDAPSSSANPAPAPSPSPAPQPSPSSSAAPAPSSSSGNGGQSGSLFQGTHTGDGTKFARFPCLILTSLLSQAPSTQLAWVLVELPTTTVNSLLPSARFSLTASR